MLDRDNLPGIDNKGAAWKTANSGWIIWTFFFGLLSWVSFFYIGIRTKTEKWIYWGLFYFLPFFLVFILGEVVPLFSILGYLAMVPMGLMSIIHAFLAKNEYLQRLAKTQEMAKLPPLPKKSEMKEKPLDKASVFINSDPPEKIAELPGFNIDLAVKVVLIRDMTGRFLSVEDFGKALSLEGSELNRLKPFISLDEAPEPSPADLSSRIKIPE